MANSKLVFTMSSILLALLFFNGIFSALGRPLMKTENKDHVTTYEKSVKEMAAVAENIVLWRRHILENDAANAPDSQNPRDAEVEKWIDDFRPTDPGHSPGAGHSSPHANVAPRP